MNDGNRGALRAVFRRFGTLLLFSGTGMSLSCGLIADEESSSAPLSVEGEYMWVGTRVSEREGKALVPLAYAMRVSLGELDGRHVLMLPGCLGGVELMPLSKGQGLFVADGVTCSPDALAAEARIVQFYITALRLDLAQRALSYRFCEVYDLGLRDCGQHTSVFSPLQEVEAGSALGGNASDDRSPSSWWNQFQILVPAVDEGGRALVNFADSAWAWQMDRKNSKFRASGGACTSRLASPGTYSGYQGTVHRLKNGSYYLAGYDCVVPNPYNGAPLRCGGTFTGLEDVGTPVAWLTRFEFKGSTLSFAAEMRGDNCSYNLTLDAPIVPL